MTQRNQYKHRRVYTFFFFVPLQDQCDILFFFFSSPVDVFFRAKEVETAIRAKDLGPALRWCEDNSSRLRKLESKLEFRVRERAFLEMVRANKKEEVCIGKRLLCLSLECMLLCRRRM